jgi:hypothetical protein
MNSRSQIYSILVLCIFVLFLIPYGQIRLYLNSCFNVNDFGLYQQAIYEFADTLSFNPYISLRGVRVFNDHFDPAALLATWIPLLFGYNAVPIILFQFSFYLLGFFCLFKYYKKRHSNYVLYFTLALFFTTFSRGFLNGALDALRPMLWAFPLVIFVPYFLRKNKFGQLYLLTLILFLFKEIYLFYFFGYFLIFVKRKNVKLAITSFLTAVFLYIFISKIRPMIFGPVIDYSNNFVSRLLMDPIGTLSISINSFKLPYKSLIPLFVLLGYNYKRSIKDRSLIQEVLLLLLPVLLIHILAGRMAFHQVTPIIYVLLGTLYITDFFSLLIVENRRVTIALIFPILFTASSRVTKFVKNSFSSKTESCEISSDKILELNKVKKILSSDSTAVILATSDLIPYVNDGGMKIYQMYSTNFPKKSYNYLVTAKYKHSDTYPLTNDQLEKFNNSCEEDTETIFDGKYYKIKKGKISKSCMKLNLWGKPGDPLTIPDVEELRPQSSMYI